MKGVEILMGRVLICALTLILGSGVLEILFGLTVHSLPSSHFSGKQYRRNAFVLLEFREESEGTAEPRRSEIGGSPGAVQAIYTRP